MKRQNIRKLLVILSLLLFPITIWYLSPYLIIMGAMEGIVNGSFIVFCCMLIGSIFFGRFFCGWICPMGGLQECLTLVNDKNPKQGWRNNIKYVIWTIWVIAIVICFIFQDQTIKIDFLYQTDHGISVSNIYCYIIYYGVILLGVVPSVCFGKRLICHYFCWMAPFMVLGTKIRRGLHLPGLHIKANSESCISCGRCNKSCPMGVDVIRAAKEGGCYSSECIQCGVCADSCPKDALKLVIGKEKQNGK